MLFTSYEFIFVFLPICVLIYFALNRWRMAIAAKSFLLMASLFFYSWWNIAYLPLVLTSMLFNYAISTALSSQTTKVNKKLLLVFGIGANLVALGYFKYADFFISNINILLNADMPLLHLALPLAISFFTFQQIAYLIDSYKAETLEYDFLNYAIFVSFFPQLIAGPIVHHKDMMPQFDRARNFLIDYHHILAGLLLFSVGLMKKVVIADSFALWANYGFDEAVTLSTAQAWITSLSYSLQLYFDFSGYCDMAMGTALIFNIKLPFNFNSPYKALNIQDFWRRWHITLSRFLRDYLYIPLGGNRYGAMKTATNVTVTFLLGGLWHGAGWGFIMWGGLHGVALVLFRIWNTLNIVLPKALAWLITFNFVNVTWVFFRAGDWEKAMLILSAMIKPLSSVQQLDLIALTAILAGLMTVTLLPNSNQLQNKQIVSWFETLCIGVFFFIAFTIYEVRQSSEFLYFQF